MKEVVEIPSEKENICAHQAVRDFIKDPSFSLPAIPPIVPVPTCPDRVI